MYVNAHRREIMFTVARHVSEIVIENIVLVLKFATVYNNILSIKDKNSLFFFQL
jgi:hypothetical protein